MSTLGRRRARSHRGVALVEFVIVCNLFFLILFSIIEMGLIFKDNATIAQGAREAARSASVGSQTSVCNSRAISTATGMTLTTANITLTKSTDNGTTWIPLGNTTGPPPTNDAVTGNMVRATIIYNHPLITSMVFTGGTKQLSVAVVMRRE